MVAQILHPPQFYSSFTPYSLSTLFRLAVWIVAAPPFSTLHSAYTTTTPAVPTIALIHVSSSRTAPSVNHAPTCRTSESVARVRASQGAMSERTSIEFNTYRQHLHAEHLVLRVDFQILLERAKRVARSASESEPGRAKGVRASVELNPYLRPLRRDCPPFRRIRHADLRLLEPVQRHRRHHGERVRLGRPGGNRVERGRDISLGLEKLGIPLRVRHLHVGRLAHLANERSA